MRSCHSCHRHVCISVSRKFVYLCSSRTRTSKRDKKSIGSIGSIGSAILCCCSFHRSRCLSNILGPCFLSEVSVRTLSLSLFLSFSLFLVLSVSVSVWSCLSPSLSLCISVTPLYTPTGFAVAVQQLLGGE